MVDNIGNDKVLEFLADKTITRVFLDFSFGIELFSLNLNTTIRIAETIDFFDSGTETTIDPHRVESVAPLLKIFNSTVQRAVAKYDGTLVMELSHDRKIVVRSNTKYEAWELFASNGVKIVSMPGGGLSTWEAISK